MSHTTNLQQTAEEDSVRFTNPTDTTEANTEDPANAGDEHEPLLARELETDLRQGGNSDETVSSPTPSLSETTFHSLLRYGTWAAYACLAFVCATLGLYVFYVLLHIPTIISLLRDGKVEFGAAALLDTSDSSVALSATLRFPGWSHRSVMFPFANVTVFHKGDTVGWLCARNIEIDSLKKTLELSEVFHIVDQDAMGRLLSETAVSRHIAVDTKAVVDLSRVGRFLPTVTTRRKLSFTLPTLHRVSYSIHDIEGPVVEKDGIVARALFHVAIPYNVSANIDKLCLDACYTNLTLAKICAGPTSIDTNGRGTIPVSVHIPTISGSAHEDALASILRGGIVADWPELVVTGSNSSEYTDAPIWLRRALNATFIPIKLTPPRIPQRYLPPINELVTDTVVDKFYAYWSANKSYHPWVGLSAKTTLSLPNLTRSDVFVEVQSLVPYLDLVDNELGPVAAVTTENFSFSTKQLSPLCFCASCSCDRLGLDAIPGMEHAFTQIMKRSIVSGRFLATVNGTLDVVFQTSIGRLRVESMPFHLDIDRWVSSGIIPADRTSSRLSTSKGDVLSTGGIPRPAISHIHISNTTQEHISLDVDLDVKNPFSYGAYMSDIAFMLRYSGLHIATVGLRELALSQGQNDITLYVGFYNHATDPRQQMFFLQASSGKNVTVEIAGFPNCTSITPLEVALRDFAKEIVVDTSKFKSGDSVSSGVQSVLREIVFHAFAMAVEATVVNPVSGADIWLQSIEAVGYYDGDISLGTMDYDFTLDREPLPHTRSSSVQQLTNGLLLPFKMATTTPYMPVSANKTSIGWDVVRRAVGGTLNVDVFTNIQLLVGSARLNLTLAGENAPVKIRF